jgi:5-methylcytosine-specific restriction endonuclease McrA
MCKICGDKAEQVHHLTYAHVYDEYTFELVSLCKKCHHEKYHSDKPFDTLIATEVERETTKKGKPIF